MPLSALALILVAAFCHATWNLILKRSKGGGIIFFWLVAWIESLIYAPVALRQMTAVKALWASERRAIFMVAVLSPLSYCLALFAMKMAPLSYVAPARETSILIAALYGTHFLKEGDVARRLSAAALMVLGLAGIALA